MNVSVILKNALDHEYDRLLRRMLYGGRKGHRAERRLRSFKFIPAWYL